MPVDRRTFLAAPLVGALGMESMVASAAGPRDTALSGGSSSSGDDMIATVDGDATSILQESIDRVSSAGGGRVRLAPGEHFVTSVSLASNVELVGCGAATRILGVSLEAPLKVEGAKNVCLTSISVSKALPGDGAAAIQAVDGDHLIIDRVHFSECHLGIDFLRVSGAIRNSTVSSVANAGIFAMDSKGLEISHNLVEDCGNNGIQIWRSSAGDDGSILTANRILNIRADDGGSGQNGNGINVFRAAGVLSSGNRIEDCAYSAFRTNAGSNCQFVGNSCKGLGEVAVYAEFGFQGALIANNVIDDAASGISITNFNEGGRLAVCSGNLIRNLHVRDHFDRRGTGISAEADTLINANVIEGAPVAGISLGWGAHLTNVVASGNLVRTSGTGIAISVAEGAGKAVVSGNLFADIQGAAIRAYRFEEAVGDDLIVSGSGPFPNIELAGNIRS